MVEIPLIVTLEAPLQKPPDEVVRIASTLTIAPLPIVFGLEPVLWSTGEYAASGVPLKEMGTSGLLVLFLPLSRVISKLRSSAVDELGVGGLL